MTTPEDSGKKPTRFVTTSEEVDARVTELLRDVIKWKGWMIDSYKPAAKEIYIAGMNDTGVLEEVARLQAEIDILNERNYQNEQRQRH